MTAGNPELPQIATFHRDLGQVDLQNMKSLKLGTLVALFFFGNGLTSFLQAESLPFKGAEKTPGALPTQSVREVKRCFPKLDIGELLKSSSLATLKEIFDRQSIVLRKDLRTRAVLFRELPTEPLRRLRLVTQKNAKGQLEYILMLQKLDAEGTATDLPIPAAHKINPKPSIINSYFAAAEVLEDEREFLESTKDGHTILSKFRRDELFSLDVRKNLLGGSLYCERKDASEIYCSCEGK